jgi:hypothetical protein
VPAVKLPIAGDGFTKIFFLIFKWAGLYRPITDVFWLRLPVMVNRIPERIVLMSYFGYFRTGVI